MKPGAAQLPLGVGMRDDATFANFQPSGNETLVGTLRASSMKRASRSCFCGAARGSAAVICCRRPVTKPAIATSVRSTCRWTSLATFRHICSRTANVWTWSPSMICTGAGPQALGGGAVSLLQSPARCRQAAGDRRARRATPTRYQAAGSGLKADLGHDLPRQTAGRCRSLRGAQASRSRAGDAAAGRGRPLHPASGA